MTGTRLRITAVLLAATLATGCGTAAVDPAASDELQELVEAARQAAADGDTEAAAAHLEELRGRTSTLTEEGAITEERAAEIQAAVDVVAQRLGPAASDDDADDADDAQGPDDDADEADDDADEGEGKGKGKGKDKSEGKSEGKGKGEDD